MHISHHITKELAAERVRDVERAQRDERRTGILRRSRLFPAAFRAPAARGKDSSDRVGAGEDNLAARPRPQIRLDPDDLSALVGAAADGDEFAWTRLVAEFGGLLWAIVRAHRLDEADGADVAQVTWLRLLEHLGRLTEPERVGSWLATTARRECLRILRENGRTVPFCDDASETASGEMPPEYHTLVRERDDALRRSFARLRPRDQALLRMLVAEPRPVYDEIAAALDMPIGSIGPTRQRALTRLRQELDAQGTLSLMTV